MTGNPGSIIFLFQVEQITLCYSTETTKLNRHFMVYWKRQKDKRKAVSKSCSVEAWHLTRQRMLIIKFLKPYVLRTLVLFLVLLIVETGCAQTTATTTNKATNITGYNAQNPIIWADVPDPSIIRVGDTYYMSSTTMHFTPGVPIMKSDDLVNWHIVNYAYDTLGESDAFLLKNGQNAYGEGTWASSLRYHNGMFYLVTF